MTYDRDASSDLGWNGEGELRDVGGMEQDKDGVMRGRRTGNRELDLAEGCGCRPWPRCDDSLRRIRPRRWSVRADVDDVEARGTRRCRDRSAGLARIGIVIALSVDSRDEGSVNRAVDSVEEALQLGGLVGGDPNAPPGKIADETDV